MKQLKTVPSFFSRKNICPSTIPYATLFPGPPPPSWLPLWDTLVDFLVYFPSDVQFTMVINTLFCQGEGGHNIVTEQKQNSYINYTKMFLSHNLQPLASPKFIVTNVIAVELLTRKNITVLIFLTHCRKKLWISASEGLLTRISVFSK